MHRGFFTEGHDWESHSGWGIQNTRRSPLLFSIICACLLLGSSEVVLAQETSNVADLPNGPTAKPTPQEAQQRRQTGTLGSTFGVLSRRSVFFPELAHRPGALTTERKAELAGDVSIAPSRFVSSALTSAISQADDTIPGYGQGWSGYGKRFGSSLATTASANVFGTFLLASAFRQDPRYFVTRGTFKQKIGSAFRRVVVTRTDYGSAAPNWSGLLGDLMAESLANSYLPDEERTAGKTFRRFGVRVGLDAGVNIVREYWPNIFKRLGLTKLAPEATSLGIPAARP